MEKGADTVGITRSALVESGRKFLEWLSKGYAGEMEYLKKYRDQRLNPANLQPGAKSIIVAGFNYNPTEEELAKSKRPYKVAKYAWGKDYHNTVRKILKKLLRNLQENDPEIKGRICVDTAPFMDMYWAQKAGLGWQGKNTTLVSREFGRWLVIGSIILNREFDSYDEPAKDYCGKCTDCIDACPTAAFPQPYVLNATKCISYWTIESKEEKIPNAISKNQKGWVFGCDICNDVCPFNRFAKPRSIEAFKRREEISLLETGQVTRLEEEEFKKIFQNSPIKRPSLKGLIRNIKSAKKNQSANNSE